jgi:hypothetical protein
MLMDLLVASAPKEFQVRTAAPVHSNGYSGSNSYRCCDSGSCCSSMQLTVAWQVPACCNLQPCGQRDWVQVQFGVVLLAMLAGLLAPSDPRGLSDWWADSNLPLLACCCCESAAAAVQVRRLHFHDFMLDVHRRLRLTSGEADPLKHVADDVASGIKVGQPVGCTSAGQALHSFNFLFAM